MKKLRVAVCMGGPSAEHEVSLASGKKIIDALNKDAYDVVPVFISKEGVWDVPLNKLKNTCDLALIAPMHGEYGEDGGLQKDLEKAGVAYTGPDAVCSALCMDKVRFEGEIADVGVPVPQALVYGPGEDVTESPYGYPVVVKPVDRGSSVGTHIVQKEEDLSAAAADARRYSDRIMLQEYVQGREFTCGVLERDGELVALPVTEIKPKTAQFFDYKAKYEPGATEEITPADISAGLTQQMQEAARQVCERTGVRDYSRADFMVGSTAKGGEERLYVLEVNTLPGMTDTSLLPQGAAAAGITFPQLLDILITHAHKRAK